MNHGVPDSSFPLYSAGVLVPTCGKQPGGPLSSCPRQRCSQTVPLGMGGLRRSYKHVNVYPTPSPPFPRRRRCQTPPGRRQCQTPPGRRRCQTPPGPLRCQTPPGRRRCQTPPRPAAVQNVCLVFSARRRLQLDSAHRRHQRLSLYRENRRCRVTRRWCQGVVFHNPFHCLRQDNVAYPVH